MDSGEQYVMMDLIVQIFAKKYYLKLWQILLTLSKSNIFTRSCCCRKTADIVRVTKTMLTLQNTQICKETESLKMAFD